MNNFRFNLNDAVRIIISGETGVVIGRAEYMHAEPAYLVRYKTTEGSAMESWWAENALDEDK